MSIFPHYHCQGRFPLGGIFRAKRHFLLFEDQLAESGCQKTKENYVLPGLAINNSVMIIIFSAL